MDRGDHKPISVPRLREQAVLALDVLITRRPSGGYVARGSLDEHAGWRSCVAEDPLDALDGAVQLAREELAARLGGPFAADTRG
jgi:hypothetical protein